MNLNEAIQQKLNLKKSSKIRKVKTIIICIVAFSIINFLHKILKKLTVNIIPTFLKCNPNFNYNCGMNPRRCLTTDTDGNYPIFKYITLIAVQNEIAGVKYDNKDSEYIIYQRDIIKSPEGEM